MIICPQCNHQNNDAASKCEACLSLLPKALSCPHCGFTNLENAKFCGCCGYLLAPEPLDFDIDTSTYDLEIQEPQPPEPVLEVNIPTVFPNNIPEIAVETESNIATKIRSNRSQTEQPNQPLEGISRSQKQGVLIHKGTQFKFLLDSNKSSIRIGKSNHKIPPEINLETLKHSDVVSRIHARILIQDNLFYLQDDGSANGTFINRARIPIGERRLLQSGDEISLGKGNLVAFTFELS